MRRTTLVKLWSTKAAAIVATFLLVASACGGSDSADYTALVDVCDPKMEAALETWADAGLSGSITVMGGERECSIGIGIADRETGREITAETAFAIGSITKAVTGAAILQLVDDGVLNLDDTAGQHLPGLTGPAQDLVIEDLLLHISGLVGFHGPDHVPMSKAEAIQEISTLDVLDRGRFVYTNSGYSVLGLIIDEVTDEGYRQYVVDNILRDGNDRPIGGFWDGEPATPDPRAYGYRYDGSRGQIGDFAGPFWTLEANGGVGMTTLEMAEWTKALWTGKILSPGATEMLTSVRHQTDFTFTELPGWGEVREKFVGERAFATSGGGDSIGHNMDTYWLPDSDRVIVLAVSARTNMTANWDTDMLPALFNGTGIPGPAPILVADETLTARMVGDYEIEGSDELLTITTHENGLVVASSGRATQDILFYKGEATDGAVEQHEQQALDLIEAGTSWELQIDYDRLEAKSGPIKDITLIGTICCGPATVFEVLFENGETEGLVVVADERGDFAGGGVGYLERFVVYSEGGSYGSYRPNPREVFQIRPSGDADNHAIEITTEAGTVTATKIN